MTLINFLVDLILVLILPFFALVFVVILLHGIIRGLMFIFGLLNNHRGAGSTDMNLNLEQRRDDLFFALNHSRHGLLWWGGVNAIFFFTMILAILFGQIVHLTLGINLALWISVSISVLGIGVGLSWVQSYYFNEELFWLRWLAVTLPAIPISMIGRFWVVEGILFIRDPLSIIAMTNTLAILYLLASLLVIEWFGVYGRDYKNGRWVYGIILSAGVWFLFAHLELWGFGIFLCWGVLSFMVTIQQPHNMKYVKSFLSTLPNLLFIVVVIFSANYLISLPLNEALPYWWLYAGLFGIIPGSISGLILIYFWQIRRVRFQKFLRDLHAN
ncbi:MAG: hypothetical protein AAF490_01680 [Chloroflexota bacterium]